MNLSFTLGSTTFHVNFPSPFEIRDGIIVQDVQSPGNDFYGVLESDNEPNTVYQGSSAFFQINENIADVLQGNGLAQSFSWEDPDLLDRTERWSTFRAASSNATTGAIEYGVFGQLTQLQVSTVPIPAAVWLLGCGILGMIGLTSRGKAERASLQSQFQISLNA